MADSANFVVNPRRFVEIQRKRRRTSSIEEPPVSRSRVEQAVIFRRAGREPCEECFEIYSRWEAQEHVKAEHLEDAWMVCLAENCHFRINDEEAMWRHFLGKHYELYEAGNAGFRVEVLSEFTKELEVKYLMRKYFPAFASPPGDAEGVTEDVCQKCQDAVFYETDTMKREHVLAYHLFFNQYQCSKCNVFKSNRRELVNDHSRKAHGVECDVLDIELSESNKRDAEEMIGICFSVEDPVNQEEVNVLD